MAITVPGTRTVKVASALGSEIGSEIGFESSPLSDQNNVVKTRESAAQRGFFDFRNPIRNQGQLPVFRGIISRDLSVSNESAI